MEPLERRINDILSHNIPEEVYAYNQGTEGLQYSPPFQTTRFLERAYITGVEAWLSREGICLNDYGALIEPAAFVGFSLELSLRRASDDEIARRIRQEIKDYEDLFDEYGDDKVMHLLKLQFEKGRSLMRGAVPKVETDNVPLVYGGHPFRALLDELGIDPVTAGRFETYLGAAERTEQAYSSSGENICAILSKEYRKAVHMVEFYLYKGDAVRTFEKLDCGWFLLKQLEHEIEMNDSLDTYDRCEGPLGEHDFSDSESVYAELERFDRLRDYARFILDSVADRQKIRIDFFGRLGDFDTMFRAKLDWLSLKQVIELGDQTIFRSIGDLDRLWE